MKKLTFISAVTLLMLLGPLYAVYSQSPEGFTYQAEARDSKGRILTSTSLIVKALILQGSAQSDLDVWDETYNVITDKYGLFSLVIGDIDDGEFVTGRFSEINWEAGPYFLKVEIQSGSTIIHMPVTQLLSVPYALYAKSAGNEADPIFTTWNKSTGIQINSSQVNDFHDAVTKNTAVVENLNALRDRIDALEITNLLNNGLIDLRDGNHYNIVKIGNQVWMAENLKYLPVVTGPDIRSQTTPYYYVYDYNGTNVTDAKASANYATYGVLYNWPAAMNGEINNAANPGKVQGVCPSGWHLPSFEEWDQLRNYLVENGYNYDGTTTSNKFAKSLASTTLWMTSKTPGTIGYDLSTNNSTGFSSLPGGFMGESMGAFGFYSIYYSGNWWSSTGVTEVYSWSWGMENWRVDAWIKYMFKNYGIHVRCVRD